MGITLEVTTVNVINQGNRILRGEDNWKGFKFAVLNAMDLLIHTRMQYEYFISPLLKLEGVGEIKEKLDKVLEKHGECLNSMDKAVDREDRERIAALLTTYEDTAFQMAGDFSELHKASLRHPVHSMIPVVNDILAVAFDIKNDLLPDEPLNLRISNLVNYSRFLEKQEKDFEKNFPAEKHVIELYRSAVKLTIDALSEIERYLETGNKEELQKGIAHLEQLDEKMKECRKAAESTAMSRTDGFYRPAVQNVFWIISQYEKGKAGKEEFLNSLAVLEKMHELEMGELLLTDTFVFLKPEIREKYLDSMKVTLGRQKQVIESMKENLDSHKQLVLLLEEFDDLLDDFSDTGEEMLEDMLKKPDFSEFPAAEHLLGMIKQVYQGELPDSHLVKSLSSFNESLDNLVEKIKDSHETEAEVRQILENQKKGIELINNYLEKYDRKILPQAYSILEKNCLQIHDILAPKEESAKNMEMEKV